MYCVHEVFEGTHTYRILVVGVGEIAATACQVHHGAVVWTERQGCQQMLQVVRCEWHRPPTEGGDATQHHRKARGIPCATRVSVKSSCVLFHYILVNANINNI